MLTAQARPRQPRPAPRPAPGAQRAHAARRPRFRGTAPRALESPRPPPAPEVTLAGLPSNSRRAEAALGAGDGWTLPSWGREHGREWLGLGWAGPCFLAALSHARPFPSAWRWAVSQGASAATGECSLSRPQWPPRRGTWSRQ